MALDEIVVDDAISDVAAMERALMLAERGRPTVSPNPLVGCVIVAGGRVVGEGWHERPGGPHAEVVALAAAGDQARGATAFVTLEPCSHVGRTPPCTDAIIAAGVARVVAAVADPHPDAAGGAAELRNAGIDVEIGECSQQARRQNEVFFTALRTGRPFIVAKAAISIDGRIAAADGTSQWLTGPAAREAAHALRAAVDAVVVGSGTVLADDPQLTVRLDGYTGAQPLRVVLDRRGRVSGALHVLDGSTETLVHSGDLDSLLDELWQRGVRSVLIEGGASVLSAFLRRGLVDKLVVHIAPLLLGALGRPVIEGPWAGTIADAPRFTIAHVTRYDDDVIVTMYPGDG